MSSSLVVYTSSAGSGKTFTLVKEYLKLVLAHPEDFRHVLAITFTNKAAEEMKSRVIRSLVELREGKENDLSRELQKELQGIDLKEQAAQVLTLILHEYPSFAISTIDSFFAGMLRSLAREIGLPLRAEYQLKTEEAVSDITDRLLHQSGADQELSQWLHRLILRRLSEDKGWNIERDIQWIASEMIKEGGGQEMSLTREQIHETAEKLKHIQTDFRRRLADIGNRGLEALDRHGYTELDFTQKSKGPASFFVRFIHRDPADINLDSSYLRKGEAGVEGWLSKSELTKDHNKRQVVEELLLPTLVEGTSLMRKELPVYFSAVQLLRTLYLFGIMQDLSRMLADYRTENNQLLISDTTQLLRTIVSDDDTSFIYEKTGSRFKYLLIDEFQDTSNAQWKNLLPLVLNALSTGQSSFLVGDAKQSIYRWRGGEMQLILEGVSEDIKRYRQPYTTRVLGTNYRSKKEVIAFNNAVFSAVSPVIANLELLNDTRLLDLAYGEGVVQNIPEKNNQGGYVEVRYFSNGEGNETESESPDELDEDDNEGKDDFGPRSRWKLDALEECFRVVTNALDRGFRYRDIAFLVRNNKHGNQVADFLMQRGINRIITPDSMAISGSSRVRFLLNALRTLQDPTDQVSRSQLLYSYLAFKGKLPEEMNRLFAQTGRKPSYKSNDAQTELVDKSALLENEFNQLMPVEFIDTMSAMARLPVYEITEQLIRIFGLNELPDAYIQRFQDLVLEFNTKHHASVSDFLRWWDDNDNVRNSAVEIPDTEDAIRVMSIHKSKGLEFPIVILPFADWELYPKHGQLMWVDSDLEPFNELGTIGIYSGSRLEKTIFNAEWQLERSQTMIDNINLLYVAFTRAEKELYIFTTGHDTEETKRTGTLLFRILSHLSCSETEPQLYRFGQPAVSGGTALPSEPDTLKAYPSYPWQDRIRIRSQAFRFNALLNEKKDDSVRYGIQVHETLSRVKYRSDVEAAVNETVFEGLATQEQKSELRKLILEVIDHPELCHYFENGWMVRNEQDILSSSGRWVRPDRVVTRGSEAVLIDFKTGKEDVKHADQLHDYSLLLQEMGYSPIRSLLVYLKETVKVLDVTSPDLANTGKAS